MEQSPENIQPQAESPPEPVPTMSLGARLANIFVAPGEVFDAVRARPFSVANWLTPALILLVVGWVGAWLVWSQDSIKHQMSDTIAKAVDQRLAGSHVSGAEAEQARQLGETVGMIFAKGGAYAGPVGRGFIMPFITGLILWLLGAKLFKGDFGYMKAVEVASLANMISVLEAVVRPLLVIGMQNVFATPGPVLLVKDFDPQNAVHLLLMGCSVLAFWRLGILAIGLARLGRVSFIKAAVWVFGLWAGWTGLGLAMNAVSQALAHMAR